jgi:hypothetical protein
MKALTELQGATDKLVEWTEDNHMSIQPDKSNWMMASLGHQREDLELRYAGSEVKQEISVIAWSGNCLRLSNDFEPTLGRPQAEGVNKGY